MRSQPWRDFLSAHWHNPASWFQADGCCPACGPHQCNPLQQPRPLHSLSAGQAGGEMTDIEVCEGERNIMQWAKCADDFQKPSSWHDGNILYPSCKYRGSFIWHLQALGKQDFALRKPGCGSRILRLHKSAGPRSLALLFLEFHKSYSKYRFRFQNLDLDFPLFDKIHLEKGFLSVEIQKRISCFIVKSKIRILKSKSGFPSWKPQWWHVFITCHTLLLTFGAYKLKHTLHERKTQFNAGCALIYRSEWCQFERDYLISTINQQCSKQVQKFSVSVLYHCYYLNGWVN